MLFRILAFLFTFLFVTEGSAQLSYHLSNKFWRLKTATINGKQYNLITNQNSPTLQFSGGNIRGNGGCNAYRTKFTIDGTILAIDKVKSTRIKCNDLLLNESEYFEALGQVHSISHIEGSDEFQLVNSKNDLLVFFAQFERTRNSYKPAPTTRRASKKKSYSKRRSRPPLTSKQWARKKYLESRHKRGKLSRKQRKELIILQSKVKMYKRKRRR